MSQTLCFCVPDANSIIDVLRADGRGQYSGETLEEIRTRCPGAAVRTLDEYCTDKANEQDSPITWTETTEDTYWEMLEILPPAAMARGGFLVGEPMDHHAVSGQPRFAGYIQRGQLFFEASRPLTEAEFRSPSLPMPS